MESSSPAPAPAQPLLLFWDKVALDAIREGKPSMLEFAIMQGITQDANELLCAAAAVSSFAFNRMWRKMTMCQILRDYAGARDYDSALCAAAAANDADLCCVLCSSEWGARAYARALAAAARVGAIAAVKVLWNICRSRAARLSIDEQREVIVEAQTAAIIARNRAGLEAVCARLGEFDSHIYIDIDAD